MKQATKSLHRKQHDLANPQKQIETLNEVTAQHKGIDSFKQRLQEIDLYPFTPTGIEILQVNVGYMCNLTCTHCHVDAGPDRDEVMSWENMQYCLEAIDQSGIDTVDLTGGAPEMHPHFHWFVQEITKRGAQPIVRSNLVILVANKKYRQLPAFFAEQGVEVIASLPCYTPENTDQQRGDGVFKKSIEALQVLNEYGYGKESSDLDLHLVYNPIGAHLPPSQENLKQDYKRELYNNYGIVFDDLYTITNLPISRFLESLVKAGNLEDYMQTLVNSFNPAAAEGVMCRNTLSVSWDGHLFDCDFNQMLDLKTDDNAPNHISHFDLEQLNHREIQIGQHCFGCTAGAGSSCGGAIVEK